MSEIKMIIIHYLFNYNYYLAKWKINIGDLRVDDGSFFFVSSLLLFFLLWVIQCELLISYKMYKIKIK